VDALKQVEANGLSFGVLEEGSGPLVLMVHGFPDTAHSWDAIRPAVAREGFRVACPFTRGYWPSAIPADRRYDGVTLGQDVVALIGALGERSAIVVGHDWGAAAAYAAAQLEPGKVRLLVTVGVPHPRSIKPSLRIVWATRHFVRFKLPGALGKLKARDYAHVDALVKRWSPAWNFGPEETRAVKDAFEHPGCADAALDYYRVWSPRLGEVLKRKIEVPTVSFAGTDDPNIVPEDFERARRSFTKDYTIVKMPGGHFMHREHPDIFNRELISVLRAAGSGSRVP
jgi:pimeloyl-ACP methyl ester carboxylesterase